MHVSHGTHQGGLTIIHPHFPGSTIFFNNQEQNELHGVP